MTCQNQNSNSDLEHIRSLRRSGVASATTDGESTTFRSAEELARLENEIAQEDPAALLLGTPKPRISLVRFRGLGY